MRRHEKLRRHAFHYDIHARTIVNTVVLQFSLSMSLARKGKEREIRCSPHFSPSPNFWSKRYPFLREEKFVTLLNSFKSRSSPTTFVTTSRSPSFERYLTMHVHRESSFCNSTSSNEKKDLLQQASEKLRQAFQTISIYTVDIFENHRYICNENSTSSKKDLL